MGNGGSKHILQRSQTPHHSVWYLIIYFISSVFCNITEQQNSGSRTVVTSTPPIKNEKMEQTWNGDGKHISYCPNEHPPSVLFSIIYFDASNLRKNTEK